VNESEAISMKWSVRLGVYFGIPVYMHLTFLLLLAWVAIIHWTQSRTAEAVIGGIVFIIVIFVCVVLHEFGHALTARRYGIKTRDITLLPIGGLARLERMPNDPRHELWVALAGPAVNLVIAALLWVLLAAAGVLVPLDRLTITGGPFLERLLLVNVFLVAFNLIPAFPMDGGRVLRALVATRLEYTRATSIAAAVGQSLALIFGFIGLFGGNPILLFIAFFVWIGAASEASMVQMKTSLGGIPIARAMITDYRTISPDATLAEAVDLTLAGSQKDFPVVQGDSVVGVLVQKDLLGALARQGPGVRVTDVMQREFEMLDAAEMLETAFQSLTTCRCNTAPVSFDGRLVGLVTMDNIGEFMSIQGALDKARRVWTAPAPG
jgi:Zn-dependent protease/predicted transcriptional regulator